MNRLAEEYPLYDWQKNKGYPTKSIGKQLPVMGPLLTTG